MGSSEWHASFIFDPIQRRSLLLPHRAFLLFLGQQPGEELAVAVPCPRLRHARMSRQAADIVAIAPDHRWSIRWVALGVQDDQALGRLGQNDKPGGKADGRPQPEGLPDDVIRWPGCVDRMM